MCMAEFLAYERPQISDIKTRRLNGTVSVVQIRGELLDCITHHISSTSKFRHLSSNELDKLNESY
jgi:hypothetical protein